MLAANRACNTSAPRICPCPSAPSCSPAEKPATAEKQPAKQPKQGKQPKGKKGGESTSSDEDIRKLRIQKAEVGHVVQHLLLISSQPCAGNQGPGASGLSIAGAACWARTMPGAPRLTPPFYSAQELRAAGREPYAYTFPRSHSAAELQAAHTDLADGAVAEGAAVAVAGRIMSRRIMGKLAFCKLVDSTGSIQVGRTRAAGDRTAPAGAAVDSTAGALRCCVHVGRGRHQHVLRSAWRPPAQSRFVVQLHRGRPLSTPLPSGTVLPSGRRPARLTRALPRLQLYIERATIEEAQGPDAFTALKNLVDAGDIVGVRGGIKRTEKGELSVVAESLEVGAATGGGRGRVIVRSPSEPCIGGTQEMLRPPQGPCACPGQSALGSLAEPCIFSSASLPRAGVDQEPAAAAGQVARPG